MRDKTHMESVERWAYFVKQYPAEWKSLHTKFINAVYQKSRQFYKRLAKTQQGREKIKAIKKLRSS